MALLDLYILHNAGFDLIDIFIFCTKTKFSLIGLVHFAQNRIRPYWHVYFLDKNKNRPYWTCILCAKLDSNLLDLCIWRVLFATVPADGRALPTVYIFNCQQDAFWCRRDWKVRSAGRWTSTEIYTGHLQDTFWCRRHGTIRSAGHWTSAENYTTRVYESNPPTKAHSVRSPHSV